MSGVSKCRVVCVAGREGAWWLPAGGIRASQGTFSSLKREQLKTKPDIKSMKNSSNAFHLNSISPRNQNGNNCTKSVNY